MELGQVREAVPAVSLEDPTVSSWPHSLPYWIARQRPGFAPSSRSPSARLPARCMACVVPAVPPAYLASLAPGLSLPEAVAQLISLLSSRGWLNPPPLLPPEMKLGSPTLPPQELDLPGPSTDSRFRKEENWLANSNPSATSSSISRVEASVAELPGCAKTFGSALGGVTGAALPRSA